MVLDENGSWEAVLETAFDVIVTGEVNGADMPELNLPFHDPKRSALQSEKRV